MSIRLCQFWYYTLFHIYWTESCISIHSIKKKFLITQTTTIPAKLTQNVENPFFNHIRNLQTTFGSKFNTQIGDPAVLNSLNINDTHLKQQQQPKLETQTTETLWTLPTNDSVLAKSQHHATSHCYWNELVKLHHLALPAAPNKSTPINLCGLVLERQKERDKRDGGRRNKNYFFNNSEEQWLVASGEHYWLLNFLY